MSEQFPKGFPTIRTSTFVPMALTHSHSSNYFPQGDFSDQTFQTRGMFQDFRGINIEDFFVSKRTFLKLKFWANKSLNFKR